MTKERSQVLKGVAILMMLWLHCFNIGIHKAIQYEDIIINGNPLCDIIARCMSPVSLYIMLSGYGLWIVYSRDGKIKVFSRLKKIYLLYWLTLLFFVPIGIMGGAYNGSINEILLNVVAYKTTYNSTIWFLFPYALLLLSSNLIFKMLTRQTFVTLVLSVIVGVISYGISWATVHKYIELPFNFLATLNNSLGMVMSFVTGAYLNKVGAISKFEDRFKNRQLFIIMTFSIITVLRCLTEFSFMIHYLYTICIILFMCTISLSNILNKLLLIAGKLSTVVWFVHAFLLWYLFDDYFFGLKYPIFIYLAIVMASFLVGYLINVIYSKIIRSL